MRPEVKLLGAGDFISGILLGSIFGAAYLLLLVLTARNEARSAIALLMGKIISRKESKCAS
jgi:hypothetical protein